MLSNGSEESDERGGHGFCAMSNFRHGAERHGELGAQCGGFLALFRADGAGGLLNRDLMQIGACADGVVALRGSDSTQPNIQMRGLELVRLWSDAVHRGDVFERDRNERGGIHPPMPFRIAWHDHEARRWRRLGLVMEAHGGGRQREPRRQG